MKQRYVPILADESGKVVTPSAVIAETVRNIGIRTGKIRTTNGSGTSTRLVSTSRRATTVKERIREQGFDETIVRAILKVESGGKGFVDGRVVVRFEPHVFLRMYTAKILGTSSTSKKDRINSGKSVILPGMEEKSGGRRFLQGRYGVQGVTNMYLSAKDGFKRFSDGVQRSYAERQSVEYEALRLAGEIDRDLAFQSTSFGSGQIMGFNASVVGYSSAEEMFNAFTQSKEIQDLAMLDFLINRKGKDKKTGLTLAQAVKRGDFEVVAKLYNGDTTGRYASRMADAHSTILTQTRRYA
jgi:hypothetical protein